jgi:hypothetical protein
MIYETLLAVGALGFAAQLLLGFAHGGHHHHHEHGLEHGAGAGHHHAPTAHHTPAAHHGEGGAPGGAPAHGHPQHVGHRHADPDARAVGGIAAVLGLLSPMTIFSVALGAGAAGLLLRPYLAPLPTALCAAAAGPALYLLAVRPLQRLALGFASRPAETLAGQVAREVEAASRFDAQGRGIVTATVDGQVQRLLAHLESHDRAQGVTVAPGDRLIVTAVDEKSNVCRVTRL